MDNKYYVEIKPAGAFRLGIKELIAYHELFYFFTWRDIKVKYKQTVLGFAWAVFQPLIMTLVFSMTLGRIISFPSAQMPYPVFVISGLLFWNFFSSGVSASANSMLNNASIIRKIYFPRLIIPLSSVLVVMFDFLMAFIVFFVFLFFYGVGVHPLWLVLKLLGAVSLTIIATLGPGCFLAALNVKYRDFRYILPFIIQLGLFVTPVLYSMDVVDNEIIRFVLNLNPMTAPILMFRSAITATDFDWSILWPGLSVSISLLIAGIYYFRKTEAYFADLA
jgi:lipopolysaccharide transport system permease protein